MELQNSETILCLMRAFAGESQARNRYTMAAEQLHMAGIHVAEAVFRFTADQERAHAKVFYDFMKAAAGQNLTVDGTYPVDISETPADILRFAAHNETEEAERVYPAFAKTAEEEGFSKVAAAFRNIAAIEACHASRFRTIEELMKNGQLFDGGDGETWMCLNCGHIHKGKTAPEICPVCAHNRGYFLRTAWASYTKG